MNGEEEYEIIPTTPLRKLEKRIEKIEEGGYSSEVRKLIEQVMELIKANQKIIDEIIKTNSDLVAEISKLPRKIDDLILEMREFIKLLKTSAEEEEVTTISKEVMEPLVAKINELVEQNKKSFETNQAMLTTLSVIEKRLKRMAMPVPMTKPVYRPPSTPTGTV